MAQEKARKEEMARQEAQERIHIQLQRKAAVVIQTQVRAFLRRAEKRQRAHLEQNAYLALRKQAEQQRLTTQLNGDCRRQRARQKIQERTAKQIQAQIRVFLFRRAVERTFQSRKEQRVEEQHGRVSGMQPAFESRKKQRLGSKVIEFEEAMLQQRRRNGAASVVQRHWRAVSTRLGAAQQNPMLRGVEASHDDRTRQAALEAPVHQDTEAIHNDPTSPIHTCPLQAASKAPTHYEAEADHDDPTTPIHDDQSRGRPGHGPSDGHKGTLTPSTGGTGSSRSSSPASDFPPGAFYEEGLLPETLNIHCLREEAEEAIAEGRCTIERNTLLRGAGSKLHYPSYLPTSLEIARWLCCHYSIKPTSLRLNIMRAGDTLRFHRDPRYDGSDFTAVCCLCDDEAIVPLEFIPSENPSDNPVEKGFQLPCLNGSVYGFDERINACGRYLHGIGTAVEAGERWCILVGGLQVSTEELECNMASWFTKSAMHQIEMARSYPTGPSSAQARTEQPTDESKAPRTSRRARVVSTTTKPSPKPPKPPPNPLSSNRSSSRVTGFSPF